MTGAEEVRFCAGCGAENQPEVRFCRQCGFDLETADTGDETLVVAFPGPPAGARPWYRHFVAEMGLGVFVILILAAIAIPNFRRTRGGGRESSCYANMRVILGAVELYNMDHVTMLTSIHDKMVTDPENVLAKGQYLKGQISRPDADCRYGSFGDLTGPGRITCAVHGQVE